MKYHTVNGAKYSLIGVAVDPFVAQELIPELMNKSLRFALELGVNVFYLDLSRLPSAFSRHPYHEIVSKLLNVFEQVHNLQINLLISAPRAYLRNSGKYDGLDSVIARFYDSKPYDAQVSVLVSNNWTSMDARPKEPLDNSSRGPIMATSTQSTKQWEDLDNAVGHPIVCNFVEYSLLNQRIEDELVPFSLANNRVLVARSPLAGGILADHGIPPKNPADFRRYSRHFSSDSHERMQPLLMSLAKIAKLHSVGVAEIALAWVMARKNVIALPRAKSFDHVRVNIHAADLQLTSTQLDELNYFCTLYRSSQRFRITRSVRTSLGF